MDDFDYHDAMNAIEAVNMFLVELIKNDNSEKEALVFECIRYIDKLRAILPERYFKLHGLYDFLNDHPDFVPTLKNVSYVTQEISLVRAIEKEISTFAGVKVNCSIENPGFGITDDKLPILIKFEGEFYTCDGGNPKKLKWADNETGHREEILSARKVLETLDFSENKKEIFLDYIVCKIIKEHGGFDFRKIKRKKNDQSDSKRKTKK